MNAELKALVIKEATKLKKLATATELANLNASSIKWDDGQSCIYGQMTGNCYSNRANLLIANCAGKVYYTPAKVRNRYTGMIAAAKEIRKPEFVIEEERRFVYYSPIEKALSKMGKRQIAKLVAFLKNETQILDL